MTAERLSIILDQDRTYTFVEFLTVLIQIISTSHHIPIFIKQDLQLRQFIISVFCSFGNAPKLHLRAPLRTIELSDSNNYYMVRVNLFRQELNEITESIISINEAKNEAKNEANTELPTKILNQLKDDPKATQIMLAEIYDVSRSTIQRAITELIDQGKLKRHGSPRGGYWEVTENK